MSNQTYLDRLQLRMLTVLGDSMDSSFFDMENPEAKTLILEDRLSKLDESIQIMRKTFLDTWVLEFIEYSKTFGVPISALIEEYREEIKTAGAMDCIVNQLSLADEG